MAINQLVLFFSLYIHMLLHEQHNGEENNYNVEEDKKHGKKFKRPESERKIYVHSYFSFYVSISDFIYLYVILLIFNGDEKLNYIYISILDRFEYSLSILAVNHFSNKKQVFFSALRATL